MAKQRIVLSLFLFLTAALVYWVETSFLRTNIAHYTDIWTSYDAKLSWDGKRPLNILFLTFGTRGDHQPNIALGLELAKLGHKVTIMGLEKYRSIIEQHEPTIQYRPLYDDHIWTFTDGLSGDRHNGRKIIIDILEYSFNSSEQLIHQYLEAASSNNTSEQGGGEFDVLFGHHSLCMFFNHLTVAEITKKPIFFLSHDASLPAESYSFSQNENRIKDYGRRTNTFRHHIGGIVIALMYTFRETPWRKLRTELGLAADFQSFSFMNPKHMAKFPIFETSEPLLWPRPSNWPSHWHATGYFEIPKTYTHEFRGGKELQTWIDERKKTFNRPLLFFGQGSFASNNQVVDTQILIDACEKLQMDAVALATTIDFGGRPPPTFIKVVEEADFASIFPQCSAIVYHGGAGTSSQVIRSGKPGICIPYFLFQQIWGGKLEEMGAGTVLLSDVMRESWETNGTNLLLEAVEEVLQPEVQEAAAKLGLEARKNKFGGAEFAAKRTVEILQAFQNRTLASGKDCSGHNCDL